ncbi:TniQ family protein [Rhizobium laguerreae]|uniref:TniQ family protein n=1 Tax=Rhizobium laguerreae TaxID=1076926 RepID=UPI001C904D66|nr:TniQ family protein [Rhizobium laguerreae]MBY3386571.1 hypothetical protein [Rhizobium laguerreae]MBY3400654.1 hypothetical protein [Rhizobium laguerreae]MBY3407592.1 hypothetical protein [Rhizobium laguerreae]
MALPVTLLHHDDEAAIDLAARLAAANGFPSLRDFLAHTETTAAAIARGDADALSMVGTWSGVPASRLGRLAALAGAAGGTWRMGCATLSKDMRPGRVQRFCAQCVLEDREREAGRMVSRAYRRAWWSIRGIEGCPVHTSTLTEVAVTADGDVHDFPRFVEANLDLIENAAAAPIQSRQPLLDRYLCGRVFSDDGDAFLDGLDAHVAAEFARYLGDFLVLHDIKRLMLEDTDSREWGYNLASQGEGVVRRVVAEVIDLKRPTTKYVEPVAGQIVRWLRRNAAKEAYRPVIELMQDILERNMPFGEGQIIFNVVKSRHLYCVNSAHGEYGITKDRIRALMKANDPAFRDGLPDSRTYFNAAALRPILDTARRTMSSKEAGAALGLREDRVLDLLNAGIIEQVETRSEDGRPYTRIPRSTVEELTNRLTENTTEVTRSPVHLSLTDAARRWHRPFHSLVSMILEGSLERFVLPDHAPVFDRLRVSPRALVSPLAGGDGELMRLKEAELALGTTTITIAELLKRGYLRQRAVGRETGRQVRFVERQSLVEFHSDHVSLTEIAQCRRSYRAAIKRELENAGLVPIFDPVGSIARFYRRSDLIEAGIRL